MSGSSGAIYGLRLVEALTAAGHEVELIVSEPARRVLKYEEGLDLLAKPLPVEELFAHPERIHLHDNKAVEAAPASGSAGIEAVVICPCSMGTLARVAHGYSIGLIERAADVAMKEGRKLLMVPRETPLSVIHLENMLKLARLGVVVMPASPGFYHRPKSFEDLVDFVIGKILHRLDVDNPVHKRWETPVNPPAGDATLGEIYEDGQS
ncbi:MAG: aromatic acid decarboxylase [Planctomycetota bacterium]|nr:MAG: aromatic acid decarboxylase [Planctomycetota bacterium]